MTDHPHSRLIKTDGQWFLQVSAEHAISLDWLTAHAADLFRRWLADPTLTVRDDVAGLIEARFTRLEDAQPAVALHAGTPDRQHAASAPRHRPSRTAKRRTAR